MEREKSAKLFKNGNSQAVRLPKEFRFKGDEVLVSRQGNRVILRPKPKSKKKKNDWMKQWEDFFFNTPRVSDDFMSDRDRRPPQDRDLF